MKKLILISVLLSIVLLLNAQEHNEYYAIKSGYVKYELSGSITGTQEVWWDNYGNLQKTLTKASSSVSMFGIQSENKEHKLEIRNEGVVYTIDYETGNNTKVRMGNYVKMNNNMTEAEQKKLADEILRSMGGKRLPNEKVLSYNCEVIEALGTKVWIYKGVTLKSTSKVLGIENNKTAIQFIPKKSIPAYEFNPPADMSFNEVNANISINEETDYYEDGEVVEADDIIPTQYPYDKFCDKINSFNNHQGYQKVMLMQTGGVHTAVFMQGFTNNLTVIAISRKNTDSKNKVYFDKTNSFTQNGHRCYFERNTTGESSSSLTIDIPQYDTYISIVALPEMSKSQMIIIMNNLNF